MVTAYGVAPYMGPDYPDPRITPQPFIINNSPSRVTRKVTVTCRIDDDGVMWLRISAEGRVISEVSGDGRNLSITEDL